MTCISLFSPKFERRQPCFLIPPPPDTPPPACVILRKVYPLVGLQVALVMEPKDKEASSMYKQALELLTQALEVWPNANVKFNYLEKLLSNIQPSQSKDPATALAQGLDVMNKVLERQPRLFIRNNINHISQVCSSFLKLIW